MGGRCRTYDSHLSFLSDEFEENESRERESVFQPPQKVTDMNQNIIEPYLANNRSHGILIRNNEANTNTNMSTSATSGTGDEDDSRMLTRQQLKSLSKGTPPTSRQRHGPIQSTPAASPIQRPNGSRNIINTPTSSQSSATPPSSPPSALPLTPQRRRVMNKSQLLVHLHELYGKNKSSSSSTTAAASHQSVQNNQQREQNTSTNENSIFARLFSLNFLNRSTTTNNHSTANHNSERLTSTTPLTGRDRGIDTNGRSPLNINSDPSVPAHICAGSNSRRASTSASTSIYKSLNSCRNLFNTCKSRTESAYQNRRGAGCGPCKWWIWVIGFLLASSAWWLNSDVMNSDWMVNNMITIPRPFAEDIDELGMNVVVPPSVCPSVAEPVPVPPLVPPIYPDPLSKPLPLPEEGIPIIAITPEPVLTIQRDGPAVASHNPMPIILPVSVPITPDLPQAAPCPSCPSPSTNNNIDILALKKELTEHFTTLIKEQCVSNCECPVGLSAGGGSVGDDEQVEKMIKMAIAKYDADKTGLPDLALEPGGGSVVSTRCTKHSQNKNSVVSFFGIPIWSPPNTPRSIIQPGLVPGECWSFEGSIGYVVIKLAGPSYIAGFSLEHIPRSVSPHGHIKSAPKDFQVVGLMDYDDASTEFVFGDYTYIDNGEPLQYFKVQNQPKHAYPYVEVKVKSNHGNIEFTCLYRFRVHGHF